MGNQVQVWTRTSPVLVLINDKLCCCWRNELSSKMAAALPEFPTFDPEVDETSVGIRWSKWLERLENLLVALDIKNKERKKAIMLHYAGTKVSDIYSTLILPEGDDVYKQSVLALTGYFEPKKNLTFETFSFRELKQGESESVGQFVTRLRVAADRCDFREKEREIKDQVVFRCKSDRLRRKALREDLTLTQLLEAARAMEMSEKQAKAMEGTETEYKVDKVEIKRFGKGTGNYNKSDREKKESEKVCFNCGGRWPHENKCPAFKQKCRSCGELNHFARQCKKSQYKGRRLKAVKHDNDSEEEKNSKIHKAGQRGKKDLDCRSSSSSSDESYLYRLEEKKICQVSGICTTRAYADIEINGKKIEITN